MRATGLIVACLVVLCSNPAHAQRVNKCVQANGQTLYSMDPCPAGAAASTVKIDPAPSAPPADARAASKLNEEFEKRRLARQEADGKAAKETAEKQQAQQNCVQARGTLAELEIGRVARLDASGQRRFLDEVEITAEKSKARALIAQWCK
jgi:hypothetical protein